MYIRYSDNTPLNQNYYWTICSDLIDDQNIRQKFTRPYFKRRPSNHEVLEVLFPKKALVSAENHRNKRRDFGRVLKRSFSADSSSLSLLN